MSKVIVFGANGMAGHVIVKHLKHVGHSVTTVARNNADVWIDIKNKDQLNHFIFNKISGCDFIINCIGMLVKDSETNPSDAIYVNSWFPHHLKKACESTKRKLIHISTDCVFSGDDGGYNESSIKDGRGMYAQSKALGEVINNTDLTIRTSIIGPELKNNGTGLFHWFMNQTEPVNGYTNVFWGGVTTLELAYFINWAMNTNITGLCHLTNNERISKYNLLNLIKTNVQYNTEILPVTTAFCDKSIVNTRTDVSEYIVPTYDSMIFKMIEYMKENRNLYSNYKID